MTATEAAVLAAAAVLGFWMLGAYNRLVRLRQAVATAFGAVDEAFGSRHELLAELLAAAAPHLLDEQDATAAVEAGRQQARVAAQRLALRPHSAGRAASLALAEQVLRAAVAGLLALAKAHPRLRTDERFRTAMNSLSATQHRLGAARDAFNAASAHYNRNLAQFPTRLIAGLFGFREAGAL